MANYTPVTRPDTNPGASKHWAEGVSPLDAEIEELWQAAESCDAKLTDYCDDLKKNMNLFGELELILFNNSNQFVADRFEELSNLIDKYYEGRMEWITNTLNDAKTNYLSYKKENTHGCDEYTKNYYDDDGKCVKSELRHNCTCGDRLASSCSKCSSGGEG